MTNLKRKILFILLLGYFRVFERTDYRQADNLDDKLKLSPDATASSCYHSIHASATTVRGSGQE
jgi:hypothetical protein